MVTSIEYHTISNSGSSATICLKGGVVTSWKVPSGDRTFDVIDGYATSEEVLEGHGARSAILAPWSNRIRDSKYVWNGVEYDLGPDKNGLREGLHGLFVGRDFKLVEADSNSIVLESEITKKELGTTYHYGKLAYPVPLKARVTYQLDYLQKRWELSMRLSVQNLGDEVAPIALGWHPYIRYDGPRKDAFITMRGRTRVRVDHNKIPVDGAPAFEPSDNFDPETGILTLKPLEGRDRAFTDLTASTGGEATVSAFLHHPSGARTEVKAAVSGSGRRGCGIFHIYTGDELTTRPKESAAIEYCQYMANVFNRPVFKEEISVEPNKSRTMHVSLIHTPPRI